MAQPSTPLSPIEKLMRFYQVYKVFVLGPDHPQQSQFVADLARAALCPIFYFEVGLNDTTLTQFVRSLVDTLGAQRTPVAHQLGLIGQLDPLTPDRLGAHVARALGRLATDDCILLIQGYDQTDAIPDFTPFMEAVIHHLPNHCHLILVSRTMPALPWASLIARRHALFL